MDIKTAVAALAALAQPSRLAAFRRLVRAGGAGLPAGAVARELGVPHNTMSTHLAALARGGLIRSQRYGRRIVYRVDFDGTRALLAYLLEDCCLASPEHTTRTLAGVLPGCCSSGPSETHHETTAR